MVRKRIRHVISFSGLRTHEHIHIPHTNTCRGGGREGQGEEGGKARKNTNGRVALASVDVKVQNWALSGARLRFEERGE